MSTSPAPGPFSRGIPNVMHLTTITPETAAAWLKANKNNRKISDRHVGQYVRAMTSGNFPVNGDSIRFDIDGNILDGQHRLIACVRAGVPFQTYVVYNLPREVVSTIDRPRMRSAGDSLRMLHGVTDQNAIAATITMLIRLRDPSTFISQSGRPSPIEVDQFYTEFADQLEGVASVIGRCKYICQPSVTGAAYTLFRLQDPVLAEEFFRALATGEGLARSNPVFILRDRLIRDRAARGRKSAEEVMVLLLKTWTAYSTGRRLSMLTWSPERESFGTIWNRSGLISI